MILSRTNCAVNKRAFGVCLRFFFLCLRIFSVFSCASARPSSAEFERSDSDILPYNLEWKTVGDGVSYVSFCNAELPLVYHIVRIDLSVPSLCIACYPEAGDLGADGFFDGVFTQAFAEKNNCVVAVNANPFDTKVKSPLGKLLKGRKNIGLLAADGKMLSLPNERYAALLFYRDGAGEGFVSDAEDGAGAGEKSVSDAETGRGGWTARVVESQVDGLVAAEKECADFAFGGFFCVLKERELLSFSYSSLDSRCGAGVACDGTVLYILVAEGESPKKSLGLSFHECGRIFAFLGCDDALEFDGGSSTSLCVNGKSVLSFKNLVRQGSQMGFYFK